MPMPNDQIDSVKLDAGIAIALNALLDTDRNGLLDTEGGLFDEMTGRYSGPIVLFGAGGLGRRTLAEIGGTGLEPVCFADNAPSLHGTVVDGLSVLSAADAAAKYGGAAVFVVTVYIGYEEVVEQLKQLGARVVVPFYVLYWKYPDRYLPHYAYDLPHRVIDSAAEVREAGELLSDAASRREYVAQVWWRLDPGSAVLPPNVDGDMYFPRDLVALRHDEVFVDCGGYDGDTVLSFLDQVSGQFRSAYVFEPDPRNLVKLEIALNTLAHSVRSRIHLEAMAIGKSSGSVGLLLSDAASSVVASGDLMVPCEPLDAVLGNPAPTYLKMDIEGAEVDALMGARELISTNRPVLAISAYHLQDHLWTIPLLVDSIVHRYRYHYRRYTRQPNDDLVLYAIPEERWIGRDPDRDPASSAESSLPA
jgi:FkbM family methyltransferase